MSRPARPQAGWDGPRPRGHERSGQGAGAGSLGDRLLQGREEGLPAPSREGGWGPGCSSRGAFVGVGACFLHPTDTVLVHKEGVTPWAPAVRSVGTGGQAHWGTGAGRHGTAFRFCVPA